MDPNRQSSSASFNIVAGECSMAPFIESPLRIERQRMRGNH
jgi:hypothetical protein